MKRLFCNTAFYLCALAVGTAAGCAKKDSSTESDVLWAVSGTSSEEVLTALRARIAFRLNLKTNRATMYKNGVAVDQWNIASGDVSGAWHNGRPHFTPTGIFNVEDLQMCPAWYPRDPVNPATGKVVGSEQERQRVFAQNPQIFGPCGSRNPLGRYVLWFNGAYGMHGNSAEEVLELTNPNDRRVSGGCVRNPNAKIKSVFHNLLSEFDSLSPFAQKVNRLESTPLNQRWTITQSVSSLSMRVIVGNWSSDPNVGSSVGGSSTLTSPANPASSQPAVATPSATPTPPANSPQLTGSKSSCRISLVEAQSGVAPVYSSVPVGGQENRVASFYRLDWPVTVFGKIAGTTYYKVSRGYIDSKYISDCSENISL